MQDVYSVLNSLYCIETNINHICHFDSELHKVKFGEKSLITHISEAIDHSNIGLTYKQVVNLKDNNVFGYMLDNFLSTPVKTNNNFGARPVITIPKSKIK